MIKPHLKIDSPWEQDPSLTSLFHALSQHGATPRLVGGGVRDMLLGKIADDQDIAIDAVPEEVMKLLKKAGIHYVPTGLPHGTITAIVHKKPYQITSLRADVKTFGRHAEVAFTEDWQQDASRRDFTINAMYADLDGTIYDPFAGVADLQDHLVRFIGDPLQRIEEDYLRILRFFRFTAFYGQGQIHPAGLVACVRLAPHIPRLAKERITQEFLKLMKGPYALPVLKVLTESHILEVFFKGSISFDGLEKILNFEDHMSLLPDALLRLSAAGVTSKDLFSSLRLSKKQQGRYFLCEKRQVVTGMALDEQLYRFDPETLKDWILLQGALEGQYDPQWMQTINTWERPVFPLRGSDLKKRGLVGPAIGTLLQEMETWWIRKGFRPDRKTCLAHLNQVLE